MAADFDPQKTTQQVDVWTGQRVRNTFYPAVGNAVAVVYIDASSNKAAINALLAQIEPLADTFVKKVWIPDAEVDCKASVDVRVTVRTDVPE